MRKIISLLAIAGMLIQVFWTTPVLAASYTMAQIYNYAKQGKMDALRALKEGIDVIGNGGNTALCQSVYDGNYAAYYNLKSAGASNTHPCVNRIDQNTINSFNKGYHAWAVSVNEGLVAAPAGITAEVTTEAGLSTAAIVGASVGAAAIVGGGIALAAGGGGGGGGHSAPACVHGSRDGTGSCVCDAGWSGSDCSKMATCPGYSLDSCPVNATGCNKCQSGDQVKYRVGGCKPGWTGTDCSVTASCSGYTLTQCPEKATGCNTCQSGNELWYQVKGCQAGWSGASCSSPAACTGYTLTSCPEKATSCSTCQSGETIRYKADSCQPGWTGVNCASIAPCVGYSLTSCPVNAKKCNTCQSGDQMKYQVESCTPGWTGNTCSTAEACTGYDLTSCPANAVGCTTCLSGSTMKYRITTCLPGWTGSDCSEPNACTGYDLTSCPDNAVGCTTCQSGNTMKYKTTGCQPGWTGSACGDKVKCDYNTTSCKEGYHETGNTCQSGDTVYVECEANACEGYELTSCPTRAECSNCKSGKETKYRIDSCQDGWVISDNTCLKNTCTGFEYNTCPAHAVCSSCKSGVDKKYRVDSCDSGWTGDNCSGKVECPYTTTSCKEGYHETGTTCKSGNTIYVECEVNICEGGSTSSVANCKTENICQAADQKYYTCTACKDGWTLVDNTCTAAGCEGYSLSKCPDHAQCSSCNSAGKTLYKVNECNKGWVLSDGTCVKNDCTGFDRDTCPNHAICNSCQSGNNTKYSIDSCENGWTGSACGDKVKCDYNTTSCKEGYHETGNTCQSGDTIYKECAPDSCDGGTTAHVSHCKTENTCVSGDTNFYTCSECSNGWLLVNGLCEKNLCEDYPREGCPNHANCSSCQSGNTKKYKVDSCENGWYVKDNACEKNDCPGFSLNTCPDTAFCSECKSGSDTKYMVDECKPGWTGFLCSQETKCEGYTETSCAQGYHAVSECHAGNTTYVKCEINDCEGIPETIENCDVKKICFSGATPYYTCTSCNEGWTLENNACTPNSCEGYPLDGCPTGASCSHCLSGEQMKYKVNSCQDGWTLIDGVCKTNDCSEFDHYTCPGHANCSECKSGSAIKYKVDSCESGWTGSFCSGKVKCDYNTTSCEQGYHETGNTCQSGDTIYKECALNDCTGGSTEHISHCKSETTCFSGETKYFICEECGSNYSLSDNKCVSCPANQYLSEGACYSCPANSTSPANSVGITSCVCNSGYERVGNVCLKMEEKTRIPMTEADFKAHPSYKGTKTLDLINAAKAYGKFISKYEDGTFDVSGLTPVNVVVNDTIGDVQAVGSPFVTHDAINWATDDNGKRDTIGGANYQRLATSTSVEHGIEVASVIAAKWDQTDSDYWGVAPNAQIYALNAWRLEGNGVDTTSFNTVLAKNPRVWNESFGSPLESATDNRTLGAAKQWMLGTDVEDLERYKKLAQNNVVIVKAAGNDYNKNEPTLENSIGDYTWTKGGKNYSMENLFITAVASTNKSTDNTLMEYSNACGWAQEWCLTAPAGTKTASIDATVEMKGGYYQVTEYSQTTEDSFNGTSAAAPIVSGSVAFLMGAYPYLTSQQVVEILFRTANKDVFADGTWTDDGTWKDSFGNTYSTSALYGHGMVDLGAATDSLGIVSIPTSVATQETTGNLNAITKVPVSQTKLALPRALNSTLSVALPQKIMGLDDYNRPFEVETTGFVTQAHRSGESFRRYFKSFMNKDQRTFTGVPGKMTFEFASSITDDEFLNTGMLDIQYYFNNKASLKFSYRSDVMDEEKHFDRALLNPFLNMKDSYALTQEMKLSRKLTFKLGTAFGENGFYRGDEDKDEEYNRSVRAFTTEADYKVYSDLTLKVLGGMLSEKNAVLGIHGTGALDVDNSQTYYTGGVIEYCPIPKATLSAAYYYGQTNAPRTDSLISFSDIASDGFALDARYQPDDKRMFGIQFSSPLRIRKGTASLSIPTARDMSSDTVYYDTVKVGLKPDAREYDVGVYYTQETDDYDWRGELMTRFHPDHMSGMSPDYRALFGLSFKY